MNTFITSPTPPTLISFLLLVLAMHALLRNPSIFPKQFVIFLSPGFSTMDSTSAFSSQETNEFPGIDCVEIDSYQVTSKLIPQYYEYAEWLEVLVCSSDV